MTTPHHHRVGKAPGNKGKTYIPTLMAPADVQQLLNACGDDLLGLRGKAVIGLLYRTGITVSELIALEVTDVNLDSDRPSIDVHGRESLVDRRLALDAAAVALLRPWYAARAELPGDNVFCAAVGPTTGGQWTTSGVRRWLHLLREDAGLSAERVNPHSFRYSLFAELVVEQWPLQYIQVQMGVTSLRYFENFFEYLGVEPPADEDVMNIVLTRGWEPRLEKDA